MIRWSDVMRMAGLATVAQSTLAHAQTNYPTKPVRIVVPYVAGTPSDLSARLLG
jgi:tripartite-type tricarboxylate transporter receptor subunit TctC